MDDSHAGILRKSESKYKIGKVKQTPSVQKDPVTGLSFIELKAALDEKVYGCTKFAGHYKEEKKLGQGTFGEVYKGIHLETQRQVAMKKIIVNVEKDLFPITAQREITILRRLDHKNIIKLIEMVYDYSPGANSRPGTGSDQQQSPGKTSPTKSFYMILPYMVSDLSGILHNPRINLQLSDVKNLMLQLLESINYIHCQKFMHRDIKTANILIDHNGVLKLADFGLARLYYGAPPNLKYPGGAGSGAKYTSVVVTRWYRAPELVLGDKYYTTAVDIWGAGCVFAEFFEKKPILQGKSDIDQGHVIFKLLGTPKEENWPLARYLPGAELTRTEYPGNIKERFGKYLDDIGLDFLIKLLALDPNRRLTAMSAVHHPFFKHEPLPSSRLNLPCEESHEADIKRYKEEVQQAMSQKAPTAPKGHVTESSDSFTAKKNFPKAPAKNPFPKGPAQKPGINVTARNHPSTLPYNRSSSRYNNNINNVGSGEHAPVFGNSYKQSEHSRYSTEQLAAAGAQARPPKAPQSSRYQYDDTKKSSANSYNKYRAREKATFERVKPNVEEMMTNVPQAFERYADNKQRNTSRLETAKLPTGPLHSRNDSWKPASQVPPSQMQAARQNTNGTTSNNGTGDNGEKNETSDIADLY